MRYRLAAVVTVVLAALAVAGSAFAFDCIRVSSSLQGLQQSTRSGNWLAFDLSNTAAVQKTFQAVVGAELTTEAASCVATRYATHDVSPYLALGIGVAGGKNDGPGVLAWRNKSEHAL